MKRRRRRRRDDDDDDDADDWSIYFSRTNSCFVPSKEKIDNLLDRQSHRHPQPAK